MYRWSSLSKDLLIRHPSDADEEILLAMAAGMDFGIDVEYPDDPKTMKEALSSDEGLHLRFGKIHLLLAAGSNSEVVHMNRHDGGSAMGFAVINAMFNADARISPIDHFSMNGLVPCPTVLLHPI